MPENIARNRLPGEFPAPGKPPKAAQKTRTANTTPGRSPPAHAPAAGGGLGFSEDTILTRVAGLPKSGSSTRFSLCRKWISNPMLRFEIADNRPNL